MTYLPLCLALFANLWIWRIFSTSFIIFVLLIILSLSLYRYSLLNDKFQKFLITALWLIVVVFQIRSLDIKNLSNRSNDDQRLMHLRLNEYPPVYLTVFGKTLWLPVAHWSEEHRYLLIADRLTNNFYETIDLNKYFLAGHPTERIGVKEFEKYPYLYIPVFIAGLYLIFKKKERLVICLLLLTIGFLTYFGCRGNLDAFILLPFISLSLAYGFRGLFNYLNKLSKNKRQVFYIILFLLIGLVLIQIGLYEKA